MSQYYFAVASLPQLTYEIEKLPSIDHFLETCEVNVSAGDLKLIKAAIIDDFSTEAVPGRLLKNWYVWEKNLRNKLVLLRARKRDEDPEKYLRENPDLLIDEKIVREAFEHESPLAAEDILNWERWSYLEDVELGHYFDTERLIIYY